MLHSRRVVLLTAVFASVSAAVGVRDYCPWEKFNATCRQPNEVILMTSALYGRMRYGRCVRERRGSEGCSLDALRYLDGLCSGRYKCLMGIPDSHLHKAQPCPRELMSYLEASYLCVPVQGNGGGSNECRRRRIQSGESPTGYHYGFHIHGESGFLASVTTRESMAGTGECPWILRTQPGQRIILSLISFQMMSSRKAASPSCAQTIVVEEWNQTTESPSCSRSSEQREKRVYLSTSNELQVYIKRSEGQETMNADQGEFLIKYQAVDRLQDDRESEGQESEGRERKSSIGDDRCNETNRPTCHLFPCSSASCLEKIKNATILSSEIHKDRPELRGNVACCPMPNTNALLLIGFVVAISVALGVISLFVFLHCVNGFSRAASRRDSKSYRSSRVGLGFVVEGDDSRGDEEDSRGRVMRTKACPEQTMGECRGHNCIYQKLNNIHIVESSRIQSHPPSAAFPRQSPGVELEQAEDDDGTEIRGLRCVVTVPDNVLFRDLSKT